MANLDGLAPIFVSGHRGMVGSAIVRQLQAAGFANILTASRQELDLRDQTAVSKWFVERRSMYVIHAAGAIGGFQANSTRPAAFLRDNPNPMIQATMLHAAWQSGVAKLLYLGSSCVYPRDSPQPIREVYLLSGPLEPTNEPYAIAKFAGVKSCEAYGRQYGGSFIAAMPTNLYGPNDNDESEESHVVPARLQFHEARLAGASRVVVWGSGRPRREFLHVDDLAVACLFLLERYDEVLPINVGVGEDVSIAELIRDVVCPGTAIKFDATRPDGAPRKLLDVSRLQSQGWRHTIELRAGLAHAYRFFFEQEAASAA